MLQNSLQRVPWITESLQGIRRKEHRRIVAKDLWQDTTASPFDVTH
jgi:hypothetical protein